MKTIFAALAAFCACTVSPGYAHAHSTEAAPIKHAVWRWPLDDSDRSKVVQDFAECGGYVPGCDDKSHVHHTGLDIGAPEGTPVKAVADGYVVRLVPNDSSGCDPACTDHGDGNTIIIAHGPYGKHNELVYSQYQHLSAFEVGLYDNVKKYCTPYGPNWDDSRDKEAGHVWVMDYVCPKNDSLHVGPGDTIGKTGRSGFGQQEYKDYGPHLHFEAKTFSTLYSYVCFHDGDCCPSGKCFGYTRTHPFAPVGCKSKSCRYGYLDPVNWLEKKARIKGFLHVKVGPNGEGVTLRLGPNRQYDSQDNWHSSDGEYWATAVEPDGTDQCDKGWYKVLKLNSFPPPISDYFDPTNVHRPPPQGKLPDTWVCIGNGSDQYVVVAP